MANVLVVGEESGGGYYGNSAMHVPEIVLPNSKLRVTLPLYRLVMDKNRAKGRGVLPDNGKYHYRRYERHYFQPYSADKAYRGNLLLIS